jgi:type I restriction enzyme S subunit
MSNLEFVKLNQVCKKITDGSHYSPKGIDNGYPMLSVKDMLHNGFSYADCKYVSEEDYNDLLKSDCVPKVNDVLIAKDGSYLKHVFVIKEEKKQGILSSIGILRPDLKKINPEYLKYYLHSNSVKETVAKKYVSGSALPRIILKNFGEIDVIYKPLIQQNKIAKVLSDLDAKIEINNRINAQLEAMAKTLYDYWFVQFDFPDANNNPYKTSGGKMVWNEELKREIPESWEVGTLNSIGDIIGGSTPSKAIESNFCNGEGTPWITPKDLSNNKGKKFITRGEYDVTELGLKEASLKIMPKGTVLLSSRAPIGYLAIARNNVTTNQGFKSFVPKNGFSSEYVFHTIQNHIPEIEANSSGSTFKEVSTSTLRTIKTILPANSVLSSFYDKIKPIFKKQDCLELENQELASLRDWLLPMLMNGQVSVGEVEEELRMVAEERASYGK